MLFQLVQPAIGDVLPGLLIRIRAPIVVREFDIERAQRLCKRFKDDMGGIDHLGADAVSGDRGDTVSLGSGHG